MKFKNPFRLLSRFELGLWLTSLVVVTLSFFFSSEQGVLALIASLIGITALIFVAKGHVMGQFLTVIFAVFYGVISYFSKYYGEMITYLCMSAPMAIFAMISWLRHPYQQSEEVEVSRVTKKTMVLLSFLSLAVTVAFYFILKALGNASLFVSTLSVATSFFAASLVFLRSPFYGIAYGANDVVLIVLWIIASIENPANLPMVACFVMFLANDMYGFINWQRMKKRQAESK